MSLQENEIQITNYKFEKRGEENWQISSLGHLATADHWSWLRTFKWKGRLHISIQFNLPFVRALRYDYIFDVSWICLLIYLQILAIVLGAKADEGDTMNLQDGWLQVGQESIYWVWIDDDKKNVKISSNWMLSVVKSDFWVCDVLCLDSWTIIESYLYITFLSWVKIIFSDEFYLNDCWKVSVEKQW